jgi:superfamily II DNA or RNA helicase
MSEYEPRPYQQEAIDRLVEGWRTGRNRLAVVLPTGAGKGHPADTEVPTPDGIRKWGDLQPGDQVLGSNGQPTKVLAVYDRGILPTYRVQFSDGSTVVTDADHLWNVRDGKYRRTSREHRTLSTAQIANEGLRFGRSHRFHIPMAGAAWHPDRDLPIDPYTLGTLIANGCMVWTGTTLTTPDPDVIGRIRRSHAVNRINDSTEGVCDRYSLPGLTRSIADLGLNVLSADKHIPAAYLEAPIGARVALLQGLMDGDGSSRAGGRRSVEYSTTSEQLAGDVVELVASLGGTAVPHWTTRTRDGRTSRECSIGILLPEDIEPFSTPRKTRSDRPRRIMPPRRAVVAITPNGEQQITCIRVEAEDSLYLVTRQHIVTHNTVVFANLIRRLLPDIHGRALVIAHREELITQAAAKIRAVAPGLRVGIVKAERDEHQDADVIVASIQTLASPRRREAIENIGLVIVDECHHAAARTYIETLDHFGANRGVPVAGFTATLTRRDGGLAEVWQDVVYRLDILDLIAAGHLVDPRGKRVVVGDLDLDSVKTNAGDLQDGQLGEALEASGAAGIVADAYAEHAADRPGVIFTPTVSSAEVMTDAMNAAGIPTGTVWGAMPKDERTVTLDRYRAGDLQVLSNCMVLTEGFDHPPASCAVIARPTKSPGLYVQMAGRVLRPSPGKTDALILDVMGASTRHKLASIVDLTDRAVNEPAEGQSLGEAAEEQERAGIEAAAVAWEDVDLFHASQIRWLRTDGGTWFIPTDGTYYFLDRGQRTGFYKIRSWTKETGEYRDAPAPNDEAPLEFSMIRAETFARRRAAPLAQRSAMWRSREPSEKQIKMCRFRRIRVSLDWTSGDVSDALDVHEASAVIDRRELARAA